MSKLKSTLVLALGFVTCYVTVLGDAPTSTDVMKQLEDVESILENYVESRRVLNFSPVNAGGVGLLRKS